ADASAGPGGEGGGASGGGLIEVSNDPAASITNTTIAANVARSSGGGSVFGGGAYLSADDPGTLTVMASTIAANRTEGGFDEVFGGNLRARRRVSFGDTIVASPIATQPGTQNCLIEEGPESLGFNLDSTDQCGFHGAGDKVGADPLLGPL